MRENILLMLTLLLFELCFIDTLTDGMVDSVDNKILREQMLNWKISKIPNNPIVYQQF